MFKKGYEVFVTNPDELKPNTNMKLEIRDCDQYRAKIVNAVVAPPEEELPGSEDLWVRGLIGYLITDKPWRIKISQVLEER